jgi:hypothetical protein
VDGINQALPNTDELTTTADQMLRINNLLKSSGLHNQFFLIFYARDVGNDKTQGVSNFHLFWQRKIRF